MVSGACITVAIRVPAENVGQDSSVRGTRWSPVPWFDAKIIHRSIGSDRISCIAAGRTEASVLRTPNRIGHAVWGATRRRRVSGSSQRNNSGWREAVARTEAASTSRRVPMRPGAR
jgi:hypothetical protein